MVKLFTHTDLDGIGCAVLARLAYDNDVDIEYCNYDEINDKVKEFIDSDVLSREDMCFITDISVTEKMAFEIDSKYDNVYLLDHHPTALSLNKFIWCTVKVEDEETKLKTCGTEMYYKWLVEAGYLNDNFQLMEFVSVVRDYDTWRWTAIGDSGIVCKQINDLLYLYGKDKFIDWCISKINNKRFPLLSQFDELLLRIRQAEIDDYIESKDKQLLITELCGKTCGIVFAEKYFSELGNRLCKLHLEIDFVAMIDMDGTISYRTAKDNIDLGKDVAQLFGGGGHPKAAGSQFSQEIKLKIIENIFS